MFNNSLINIIKRLKLLTKAIGGTVQSAAEKRYRYSIRKFSFGATSVAISAFMFLGTSVASSTVAGLSGLTSLVSGLGLAGRRNRRKK